MKLCKKQCRIYKIRAAFLVLYIISWGLTIAEFVAVFCILLRGLIMHWCGSVPVDCISCLLGIVPKNYFEGLKDVAMTVGLTGVLFAWLLQIIGEQTCGIPMDELFHFEFHGYTKQMVFFIQATMVCIYTCSCKDIGRLLAPISFLNMLCGIVNMWLMCIVFLFSTDKRRDSAFCCLKSKLPAVWNADDLTPWTQELDACLTRGEKEHIETYFDLFQLRAKELYDAKDPEPCTEFCGEVMRLTWIATGTEHWNRYLVYLLKPPYNEEVPYLMIAAYLLQSARLREKEMGGNRYFAVAACLHKGTENLQKVPAILLALYLAFFVINESISEDVIPEEAILALKKINWDMKLDVSRNKADDYRNFVLRWVLWSYGIVCSNDCQAFVWKQDENLERRYNTYMDMFPWLYREQ